MPDTSAAKSGIVPMGLPMPSLESILEYAYVAVYKGSDIVCEGMYATLSSAVDIKSLPVKSFYVFESEDGGVFVDFYM